MSCNLGEVIVHGPPESGGAHDDAVIVNLSSGRKGPQVREQHASGGRVPK
jgi:hypothetical protein